MTDYLIDDTAPQGAKTLVRMLLDKKQVAAVLCPAATPWSKLPMPYLLVPGSDTDRIAPLTPAAPFNAARQGAQVLREATGKKIALVLKPCEVNALYELAKLNQCVISDDAMIISMECRGRLENKPYLEKLDADEGFDDRFYKEAAFADLITPSCKSCTAFVPENADLTILSISGPDGKTLVRADTAKGDDLMAALELDTAKGSDAETANALKSERASARDAELADVQDRTGSVDGLQAFLAGCLNCYNCRKACPVCYCRDCVFKTDVFDAKPHVLLNRAVKKGGIKLPQDTTMFHLTRMLHMAHACVGCGQCTSACPMDIPVADLFRLSGEKIQALYGYRPGQDMNQKIPMLSFGADDE